MGKKTGSKKKKQLFYVIGKQNKKKNLHVSAGKKLLMGAEFHCACKLQSRKGIFDVEHVNPPTVF